MSFAPSPHNPTIPKAQSARIAQVREAHWDALEDALDDIDDAVSRRAKIAMGKIRASNYSPRVIEQQTRKIALHTNDITARALAQQVETAALYAQRAADIVRAWQISGRIAEGVEHLSVSPSAYARATRPGVSAIDAEAALARIQISTLRTPAQQRAALRQYGATATPLTRTGPSTSGTRALDKLRKAGKIRKIREVGLSERLHGSAARNIKETEKAVGTAIREAKNMNRAGRDLIRTIGQGGDQLAVKRRLTKPLMRLRRAGRKLQRLSLNQSDPDALKAATKAFNRSFDQIKKIAASRVDSRGGYAETVQKIDVKEAMRTAKQPARILRIKKAQFDAATKKQIEQWVSEESAKRTDAALTRWLDEKQAYHSERIIETESSAAYRAREAQQHSGKQYVTGFWWRRNVGMVNLDKKRKKDIGRVRKARRGGRKSKRKTKGRPCTICPVLAGKRFPAAYAREYPRGAHPLCRCWYEWIYNTAARDGMPVTQADLDWYDSLDN